MEMMSKQEVEMMEIWNFLTENEIATDEEIGVAIHFAGKNLRTFESLLFYKTGFTCLEQIYDEWEN